MTDQARYSHREACTRSAAPQTSGSKLRRLTPRERRDMTGRNGMIGVMCEFCSTYRAFNPEDSGA
jgi:molecular chaperone Hsp33